jgi:hypothetical protein
MQGKDKQKREKLGGLGLTWHNYKAHVLHDTNLLAKKQVDGHDAGVADLRSS